MFRGFSPETIDFLWGIRMNNRRDWFLENKAQYIRCVYEPMKELGSQLFEPFAGMPGLELKVSRIYRDARLQPAQPYKDSLWLCIRRAGAYWAETPCLYLEIAPEGASCGFLLWRPRPAMMEAFRRELAAEPRPFLERMEAARTAIGYPMTAECYKKPTQAPSAELQPYYAWRQGLCWSREFQPGEILFGPELHRQAAQLFAQLQPIYTYFDRYCL